MAKNNGGFSQRFPFAGIIMVIAVAIAIPLTSWSLNNVSTQTTQEAATPCSGKPYVQVWKNLGYTGATKIWCTSMYYGTPGGWGLNVSYVGDEFNDHIGSIKMVNFPIGGSTFYKMEFYQNGGYGGDPIRTTINHNPEVIRNVYAFNNGYTEISSFRITGRP